MSERAEGQSPAAEPKPSGTLLGALVAEAVGTFLLVFIGAGKVVALNRPVGGLETPASFGALTAAIGLAFGFAVLVAVYAFGHVSGAHINPTVTVGLAAVRRLPRRAVPGYLAAQFSGAILAALSIWLKFGANARGAQLLLGATAPGPRGPWVPLFTEMVLGFLLVVMFLATAIDDRAIPGAGLAIELTIGAGVFATLNVSGGSFNAARTLGPMIVAGQFLSWWVYVVGPTLGGVLGAVCYECLVRSGAPPV